MKDFATLPETLVVEGLTLSTLTVAENKDNFGHVQFVITDPKALYARGNNEVVEGKSYLRADFVLAKFYAADERIAIFVEKAFNKDLIAAQANGTIITLDENTSAEDIEAFAIAKQDLKNRVVKNLLRAAATINIAYHKSEKVNDVTGAISQSLKVGIGDITVVLKDSFVKALDASIAKASTFNFD